MKNTSNKTELPKFVAIIVTRGEQVLVSLRLKAKKLVGYWQFPGGAIEYREAALLAAKRELREETGLDLPMRRFVRLDKDPRTDQYDYIGHIFMVELQPGEEPINPEPEKHTDWKWVTKDEALGIGLIPGTEIYLEQVGHDLAV
jgi:8-oxo-dGTP diphosphatase